MMRSGWAISCFPPSNQSICSRYGQQPINVSCGPEGGAALPRWSAQRCQDGMGRHSLGCAQHEIRRAPKPSETKHLRCAIYPRKSTEHGLEQEFDSLDARLEGCEACTS